MGSPTDTVISVEALPLGTSSGTFNSEVERVCVENEWVYAVWSPIHLRSSLEQIYWKPDRLAVSANSFWEDSQKYLYLPRFRNRKVLEQTIYKGADSKDFFGTASGETSGKFDRFKFGDAYIQFDDTLLLIARETSSTYEEKQLAEAQRKAEETTTKELTTGGATKNGSIPGGNGSGSDSSTILKVVTPTSKPKAYYGSVLIKPSTAKMQMIQVAEEIIAQLQSDPNAYMNISIEINVDFPHGASDQLKRTVSENSRSLGFQSSEWE